MVRVTKNGDYYNIKKGKEDVKLSSFCHISEDLFHNMTNLF